MRGQTTLATLSIECGAAPVAFDIHLEDGGVVDQAIDGGERHGLVWKNLAPFAEGLIGGDQHRVPLVAASNELEQHAGLGQIPADVGDVIE